MRQPFERLLLGRTLAGRYQIDEAIGAGGMSMVFRGADRTLGRAVAVKVVSLPTESDDLRRNLRERFRREAASAARIPPHPNVVQVYDYGTDPELDLDFIVMELLRGRDLKEAMLASPPAPGEALRILREAARGLAAGHRTGIVHRDVKPANVFLVGEGRLESVRLLDFGIAKPLDAADGDSITTLGQLPHSPAYASPEQLDPEAPVTPASDVYQLGLIGYEMLTRERPFSETERARIRGGEEVALVETPRWRDVPPPVREVIARALRRRPEERYPDAAAFAEALAHAEDATHLMAAPAALPVDDDHTVAIPPEAPRVVPVEAPRVVPAEAEAPRVVPVEGIPVRDAPPPPPVSPVPGAGERRPWRPSPALLAIALVVAVMGVIWALTRGGGEDDPAPVAAAAPAALPDDTSAIAGLEETFVRLQGAASESLRQAPEGSSAVAAADSAAAAAPGGAAEGGDEEESAQAREAREREASAEVRRVITSVNEAWVDGNLDRHMRYYGDRVDYYAANNATNDFVREDRGRDLRKYDEREMKVNRTAITFPSPSRARALVDKEWRFAGSGEVWTGAMRQELILVRIDGDWKIVSEKSNQVYHSRKRPM